MKCVNKCDVIVTYCWNRVGYNILKSLSSKGLVVVCADTSKKNICSMSKWCADSFAYPDPFTNETDFIECLIDKVNQYHPKVLMPTHDESLIIARYRNRFPKWLKISISDIKNLEVLSNKLSATKIAERVGVPTPRIYNSIDDISPHGYPVIIKPIIGNSAKGVVKASNKQEAENAIINKNPNEIIIEEFIPGVDICVDCIRSDSFFYGSVYKAIVTKTHGGGTTTQRVMIDDDKLVEYAKKILDLIGYEGVCGMDFRVDSASGNVGFIEANPRFTGGIATPIAAGFDIPYLLYNFQLSPIVETPISTRIGTKTKWILGDIIALADSIVNKHISWNVIKKTFSFRGFDAFDDFDKNDKKAILGEFHYYLSKLIKNGKLNP